jgi:hypothetical protein
MKTITKSINIYTFSELPPKGKETAKQQYEIHHGYPFADEAIASLSALVEHFGGSMKNYSVDFFATSHSSASFDLPELKEDEIKEKVDALGDFDPETLKGKGDCVLTGYCSDENAIDGLRIAWHSGERDPEKLMQAAFRSWLADAQADCEAYYTDENFGESSDANEREYTEDGYLFHE